MNLRHHSFLIATGLSIFFGPFGYSQSHNLIYNGSFESSTEYPINSWKSCGQVNAGDLIVDGWTTPLFTSPDYFNSNRSTCDGLPIALARTGEGRCGMIWGYQGNIFNDNNYREYVQGRIIQPLIAGREYELKFYVALDRNCSNAVSGIGCYISPNQVIFTEHYTLFVDPDEDLSNVCPNRSYCENGTCDELLNFLVEPQIISTKLVTQSDGWTEISGRFIATGNEKYITIGNFSHNKVSDAERYGGFISAAPHIYGNAYYYLDDVSLTEYFSPLYTDPKKEVASEYFLFLLDVSNSMNRSGNLELMKKEIADFEYGLDADVQVAIMAFADDCKLILPFTSAKKSSQIELTVENLKAGGKTDGDNALLKSVHFLDSLKLGADCHVVMATDGVFAINEDTKGYVETILEKYEMNIWILQFGPKKNSDLLEISSIIPESYYVKANKKNIRGLFNKMQPQPKKNIIIHRNLNEVKYTW
jgi:uncharacterized protein YegL